MKISTTAMQKFLLNEILLEIKMYKVLKGAVHHKGEVYRKGDVIPETFTNKEGYRHVEQMEKAEISEYKKQVKAAK